VLLQRLSEGKSPFKREAPAAAAPVEAKA
jgi:hypothetical protein